MIHRWLRAGVADIRERAGAGIPLHPPRDGAGRFPGGHPRRDHRRGPTAWQHDLSPFSIERLTWHPMKRFPECEGEEFDAVRQFLRWSRRPAIARLAVGGEDRDPL
ncbi:MAG: hypothetical protein U5O39_05125 [Gammaproteobacteria bacterium]|nr:hypothetical protein [Gammaproteobacteria bacterium]